MVTDRETEAQRWSWIDTAGPGLWLHGTFPGMSTYASRWQVPRSHAAWQTRLGAISEVVCILQNPHLPGIGSGTRARIHALFIAYPVEKLRPDSQRHLPGPQCPQETGVVRYVGKREWHYPLALENRLPGCPRVHGNLGLVS